MPLICSDFIVIPAEIDEQLHTDVPPEDLPVVLSRLKAEKVSMSHINDTVIGCDTVVIIDGEILGKPKNKSEAVAMLHSLSGKTHQVVSGVTICCQTKSISFYERTYVVFYTLSEAEIEAYTDTDEPYDKAGGYAIQGKASLFVKKIDGDYYNVVGFPVARLKREYDRLINT